MSFDGQSLQHIQVENVIGKAVILLYMYKTNYELQ